MTLKHHLGIVGATGAVGRKILTVMAERNIEPAGLRLFASQRSSGTFLEYRGEKIPVECLEDSTFKGLNLVFFSAGNDISKTYCPKAVEAGAIVVDNSNAFRMDPNTPLVIPEVNPQDLGRHRGIIANPNCSTIQMVMAIAPIHRQNPVKRIVVSTYQSVSGTGLEAIDMLMKQSHAVLRHEEIPTGVYPHQIAFNLFPHIDVFLESGLCREEEKMVRETQKIMGSPIPVCPTTVRVPVLYCHSEAVNLELTHDFNIPGIRDLLGQAPGITVLDQVEDNQYPTPLFCQDKDDVFVGRIRRDPSLEFGLNFWVVSDNLRRGAATNAVIIYQTLVQKRLL